MSIFKNPESCPNCVHKDVCMYKEDYAKLVADLEKDDRLLPAGVDFIEPLIVTCKYYIDQHKNVIYNTRSNVE